MLMESPVPRVLWLGQVAAFTQLELSAKARRKADMRFAYFILAMVLFSSAAMADGTHGVAVTVVNKTGGKIEILTYNGKDGSETVPHKVYYAEAGGTRTVKAHGQGTGKIRMSIQHGGKPSTTCWGVTTVDGEKIQSGDIGHNNKKYPDGSTVTVISCQYVDQWGG
jgi:hypothetical protein